MIKLSVSLIGLVMALALAPGQARADTLLDYQKFVVAESDDSFSTAGGKTFSVQFRKGAKRKVILVHATFVVQVSSSTLVSMSPTANGHSFSGGATVQHYCVVPTGQCTVSGIWWVDVDTLEAAYPGEFYGQVIWIDVQASTGAAGTGSMNVVAQLLKK